MTIIRRLSSSVSRFFTNPRLWLNLIMIAVIFTIIASTNPNRFSWGFYFVLPLVPVYIVPSALLTSSWGTLVTLTLLLIMAVALVQYGVRRWFGDANRAVQHVLLGEGWTGWAMFWLWVLVYLLVVHPLVRVFVRAASIGLGDSSLQSVQITDFFIQVAPLVVGLVFFHRAAQRNEGFPVREALIALGMGIGLRLGLGLFLDDIGLGIVGWPRLLGAEIPQTLQLGASILPWSLNWLLIIVIVSRIHGFGTVLRHLTLLLVSGTLIAIFLTYPAYTWVYETYVPQQSFSGTAHDSAVIAGLTGAVIVAVLSGSVTSRLLRPESIWGRIRSGGFVGLLIGMLVFAMVGSWVAGIAAHAPLYDFAISRQGFNDAESILQLGIAVNNTFPATLMAFMVLSGLGVVLVTIGAAMMPTRGETSVQDGLPTWVLTSVVAIPVLQAGVFTTIAVLVVLSLASRTLFTPYGFVPSWQPEWMSSALVLPQFAFIAILQVALVLWLNRTYQRDQQKAANAILLNAVLFSGLVTLLTSFGQVVTSREWWAILIGVWTAGVSIEMIRLSLVIGRDETPLTNRRRWVYTGMLAGTITSLVSWILIAAALSLVLISVVFIVDLTETTAPPPGLDYLLTNLEIAVQTMFVTPVLGISGYMLAGGFINLLLVLNFPGALFRTVVNTVKSILSRLPQWNFSRRATAGSSFVAALIADYLLGFPVLSIVWGMVFIRPVELRRLPSFTYLLLIAFFTLAVWALPMFFLSLRGGAERVASLILLVITIDLGIFLYFQAGSVVPLAKRTNRYLLYTALFAVVITMSMFVGITGGNFPASTPVGGVSRFDGSRWTVYNQQNSTLGINIQMDMLQDSDGMLWIANGGGLISTFDGDYWQLGITNTPTLTGIVEQSAVISSTEPYLAQDRAGNIWYAARNNIGRLETDQESTGSYSLETPCIDVPEDEPIPACTQFFTNPGQQIQGRDIAGLGITDDGNIWVSTSSTLHRITDTDVMQVAENSNGSFVTVDGDVWYVTEDGLYRYDASSNTAVQVEAVPDGVQMVFVDSQDTIWFMAEKNLLRLSDEDSTPEQMLALSDMNVSDSAHITALADDGDGSYWLGTAEGLIRYDPTSSTTELFTSANSGLVVDGVRDVLVDNRGDVWVATYEEIDPTITPQLFIVGVISITPIILLIFGVMVGRDYNNMPTTHAKRKVRDFAKVPHNLYSQLYDFLATEPDNDVLTAAINELNRVGFPSGGAALSAFQQMMVQDTSSAGLATILDELHNDKEHLWQQQLRNQYLIMQQASLVTHISDIHQLELMVNPGQTGGNIGLSTNQIQLDSLPDFVPQQSHRVWYSLSDVGLNLRKYAEVNDTGDRLSYLAAALSSVENAQTHANDVPPPEGVVFRQIAERWRNLIGQAVNALSGSAEIRLDLRTRQIHRSDTVTLVVKIENVGRSAAENIRISLQGDDTSTDTKTETHVLERLSPNRSDSVEFTIQPTSTDTMRLVIHAIWDDRLEQDKTIDYADEVRFYEAAVEFETIPNPYIVGHPVKTGQMFFGREDVFQFIEQNLSGALQDRTIVLYGQRRTGKTSLLYQLVDGRLGGRYIAVLIDMQSLVMLVDSTVDFLGEILYQLAQTLEGADIDIDVPEIEPDTKSPNRVFNRFIDTLCRTLGNRRLLIIFDEFELIESKIKEGKLDANILDYFRSLIQHRDNLVFIFTGTHRLEEMSHDYWSILFNIALSQKISFLSEADAQALIRNPVAGALTIDDLAVEKIIRLTGGHPFFTQLMCWALVNHCNAQKRNYATVNDVNDALSAMLSTGDAHFVYIWQQASPYEQLLLTVLGQSENKWMTPEDIMTNLQQHGVKTKSRTEVIQTLDSLVQQEILDHTTEGMLRHRIKLGVLQRWVQQSKSTDSVVKRYEEFF